MLGKLICIYIIKEGIHFKLGMASIVFPKVAFQNSYVCEFCADSARAQFDMIYWRK